MSLLAHLLLKRFSHSCFYVFTHIRNFLKYETSLELRVLVLVLFNFQGPFAVLFTSFFEVFRLATYLSYHTSNRLSRVFLNFFIFYFRTFGSKISKQSNLTMSLELFKSRSIALFSCFLAFVRAVVRQLCYNTTSYPFCQHLFLFFFSFLQIVFLFRRIIFNITVCKFCYSRLFL